MENKSQPAFPVSEETTDRIDAGTKIYSGLSKREQLAAMALQGILTKWYQTYGHTELEIDAMTKDACIFADALLRQLEEQL